MKKMIHLTKVLSDSHKSIFLLKIPFTRKPGRTMRIVIDSNKITSMKQGSHRNYMNVNEDYPVITTLTMFNKSKIDVAESIEVIKGLIS